MKMSYFTSMPLAGTAIGGTMGAITGAFNSPSKKSRGESLGAYKARTKNFRKRSVISRAVAGALLGGIVGVSAAANFASSPRHSFKFDPNDFGEQFKNKYRNYGGSAGASQSYGPKMHEATISLKDQLKGVKTKVEAQSIFRKSVLKNHPDKGGTHEAMSSINGFWDGFKNNEFNKLAFLRKIYNESFEREMRRNYEVNAV